MNICQKYGITWINHTKSGAIVFGETKQLHSQSMKDHEWILGDAVTEELYEYKNIWVVKNYVSSICSNVDDNIEKARRKAGMTFSSNFNRHQINSLV